MKQKNGREVSGSFFAALLHLSEKSKEVKRAEKASQNYEKITPRTTKVNGT